MAHKITYYGDAQIAVDKVCEFFARDGMEWFVQIETHDGQKIEGHIVGYDEGIVEVVETDPASLSPRVEGNRWNISTEDIYHLEIP
jgi:hypothetical protein